MANVIDAKGLSCPQPVILTINEIKKGSDPEIVVLVDTETSRENVSRAAESHGCSIEDVAAEDNGYRIVIRKN